MRTFLTIAILFIATSFSIAQWYKLPAPTGGPMYTIARVGNEIWTGGMGGLYTSSNEGFSWQKSTLLNGICKTILSYNDTVVICYTIIDGFDYSTYGISSFDAGMNWTAPYLLDQPNSLGDGYLKKSAKAVFFFSDFYCDVSYDGGQTWTAATTPGGDIVEVYTDGVVAIATISLPAAPYEAYYYSADGNAPWTFLPPSGDINIMLASNNRIFMVNNWMSAGSILKTDDFGITWDTILSGANGIQSLFKYNNQLYLRGPQDSLISTDNGLTWSPGTLPDAHWLQNGLYTTAGNWLYSGNGGLLQTYFPNTDTSLVTNTGIVGHLLSSLYENNDVLFTSGNNQLYRSTDGGLSWLETDSVKTTIETMFFLGDSIYAVDQSYGKFARSYDNGVSWFTSVLPTYTGGTIPGVTRLNGTVYINGYLSFYSNDEGATWDTLTPLPTTTILTCGGNNNEHGTVVSYFGSLFSYTGNGHLFRYDAGAISWDYLFCWGPAAANPGNFLTKVENYLVGGNKYSLFISSDSGITWVESLYGGLPFDGFQYYIPKNIINVNGFWFCTLGSYGVYYSSDHGMSWSPAATNPEIVPTQGLVNLNDVLYTIGYFNGVWRKQNPLFPITGKVYRDLNNNSIPDPGDEGMGGLLMITTPGNFTATSDSTGNYTLISDMPGAILPVIPNSYATFNPAAHAFSGTSANLDFGLYISPVIDDLNCDITNASVFSPGFSTNIHLTISNAASFATAPQLKLILDTALTFDSAIPVPDAITGDTLFWNIGSMDFLDESNITVSVTTSTGSSNGDTIHCMLEAYPMTGDTTPVDNVSILEEIVVGSFDPNDKTCVQGEYFTSTQLANNEELQYIVRFQNMGTSPTAFIVVTDTLSPLLDFSTFRMISSSHPCTWNMSGWGNLNVEFDPIALPPSSVDEPGSHGYFKYGIKCREAVVLGNAIDNTAAIYFDFNTPVITNTVTTLIYDPTPVTVPEITPTLVHILPYPNPSSDYIHLKFQNGIYPNSVIVSTYDVMGRQITTSRLDPSSGSLNISSFTSGIYFSVVTDLKGKRIGSFRFMKVK